MDYKTTKQLLDRYFSGESTLQEESRLRTYFEQSEIHAEFEQFRSLFQYFKAEKAQSTSANFDKKWETAPQQITSHTSKRRQLWPIIRRLSIAAAVFLAIGCAYWMWTIPSTESETVAEIDWSKYEPATEEEAVAVTRKALFSLSGNLNKGAKEAQEKMSGVKKMAEPID